MCAADAGRSGLKAFRDLKGGRSWTEHIMFLAITTVIGFGLGFWLEMSRAGYLIIALTAVAFFAGEIIHVRAAQKRGSVGEEKRVIITMLPLVIGLILVVFMLLGAMTRLVARGS